MEDRNGSVCEPPSREHSILLAVPHYGNVLPETIAGVMQATAGCRRLRVITNGASLLAHNFNLLWCNGLNLRKEAKLTHFAMLHADIGIEPFWVDTLIDEMERVGADMISAIVPIKDGRGVTSTGWMDPESKRITRFTVKETHDLPETFDAEKAGKAGQWLMLNTAAWVCRFDQPWAEEVHFEIRDRIQKNDDGSFKAVVLSEDWNFSAMLAAKGLKLFATRKVRVSHFGRAPFENFKPWGDWEHDRGDQPWRPTDDGSTNETTNSNGREAAQRNGHSRPLARVGGFSFGEGLDSAGRPGEELDALAGSDPADGGEVREAEGAGAHQPAHQEG